jgi:hypothetical protein
VVPEGRVRGVDLRYTLASGSRTDQSWVQECTRQVVGSGQLLRLHCLVYAVPVPCPTKVLGPQATFTPSIGIAFEGAFGRYAGGSSHIQEPAQLCMDGQGTKPTIL